MADESKITVERVFELMDEWRHLPAYQLERRADIFFALFLPEVLGEHFNISMNPILIPEFPIKHPESGRSNKVDYLALQQSENGKPRRAFLVELKTDMGSRRDEQDRVMGYAVYRQTKELILDVLKLCRATKEKLKYAHLLRLLCEVKLIKNVTWPIEDFDKVLLEIEAEVKACKDWPTLKAVYVQPDPPEPADFIDFKKFAESVKSRGEIGRLFAERLREWASTDAGSPNLKDLPPC